AAGVLRRRTRALTGLERWVLRSLGEEVRERRLKVPQCLLERNRRHLVQEREFGGSLPLGERGRGLHVGDAAALLGVGAGPLLQGLVVDEADAAERPKQFFGLLGGRVEAVLVRPLHKLRHVSHFTRRSVKNDLRWEDGASSPGLKPGVSAPEER